MHPLSAIPQSSGFGCEVESRKWGEALISHFLLALQVESGKSTRRRVGPQSLASVGFRYSCAGGTQEVSGLETLGVTGQVQRVVGVGGCLVPSYRTPVGQESQPAHPGPGGPCSVRGCRCGPRSP